MYMCADSMSDTITPSDRAIFSGGNTWEAEGMKAVDERKPGKHLRGYGRACFDSRVLAACNLGLFQSAWGTSGTRGQGEHEDDGQDVELVHFVRVDGNV